MKIQSVGFDADDTLWHDARDFIAADDRLYDLIANHVDPVRFRAAMAEFHVSSLDTYGYGVSGYMLSMLELAMTRFAGEIPVDVAAAIFPIGRSLIHREIELLTGVETALSSLQGKVERVLVTKGDLLHQERKLEQSGLAVHFDRIEIVSDKTAQTYRRIFGDPEVTQSAMIGNALRSDILPALEAGLWALHVPHDMTWDHEDGEPPHGNPRYRRFGDIAEAVEWLQAML